MRYPRPNLSRHPCTNTPPKFVLTEEVSMVFQLPPGRGIRGHSYRTHGHVYDSDFFLDFVMSRPMPSQRKNMAKPHHIV